MRLYRRSTDSRVVCESCLPAQDVEVSAELDPALFPGTFDGMSCEACGRSPLATPAPLLGEGQQHGGAAVKVD